MGPWYTPRHPLVAAALACSAAVVAAATAVHTDTTDLPPPPAPPALAAWLDDCVSLLSNVPPPPLPTAARQLKAATAAAQTGEPASAVDSDDDEADDAGTGVVTGAAMAEPGSLMSGTDVDAWAGAAVATIRVALVLGRLPPAAACALVRDTGCVTAVMQLLGARVRPA